MADTQGTRWRQIKTTDRQGDGTQGQTFGGGTTTTDHVAIYDAGGNVIDGLVSVALLRSGPYHVVFYQPGSLEAVNHAGAPEPCMQWTCPADLTGGVAFASAFGNNAEGYLQASPASTATCNIYKVAAGSAAGTLGTLIGSIVISTSGAFVFSLTATTFAAGDSMTAWPPNPVDTTLDGVGWTLPGTRGSISTVGGTGGTGTGTTSPTHAEALTDGAGSLIFANGDLIYATGIPG